MDRCRAYDNLLCIVQVDRLTECAKGICFFDIDVFSSDGRVSVRDENGLPPCIGRSM